MDCGVSVPITEHVNWQPSRLMNPRPYSAHVSVLPHPQSGSIRLGTEAVFSPPGQAGARESAVGKPLTPPPPRQTNHKQTRRGPRHQHNHQPQPLSLPLSAGCLSVCDCTSLHELSLKYPKLKTHGLLCWKGAIRYFEFQYSQFIKALSLWCRVCSATDFMEEVMCFVSKGTTAGRQEQ